MPLPPFSFDATVSPEGAKHDRLEIGIERGAIYGDHGDIERFLNHLASSPQNQRSAPVAGAHGSFFSRPERIGREGRLTIRERPFISGGQNYPPPLCQGWLAYSRPRHNQWKIEAQLILNPTRFVRHQQMPSRTRLFQSTGSPLEVTLFQRAIEEPTAREFPLKDWDNWFPDTRSWERFTSERFWPQHLRNCLTGFTGEVLSELRRAGEMIYPALVQEPSRFNLSSVETYWEFSHEAPIAAVLALEPMLKMFSARPVTGRNYPLSVPVEGQQNSRALTLVTRIGETLRIYAKTNRRIRIEVVHYLSGESGFRVPRGGHTFETIESVIRLLNHLSTEAAKRVNEVLSFFRLRSSVPQMQHSPLKFIADLQAACESADTAFQILQILVSNSSLIVGHGVDLGRVFPRELRRLAEPPQVLHRSNHRYCVAPAYAHALRILQTPGLAFSLSVRNRTKRHI